MINVVSIKEGLESLGKLYDTVDKLFKDNGNPKRQILCQITNNTSDRTLMLAGSHTGAGVIASKGDTVWRAPFQLAPKEATLIPIESAGWSAQCCFAYGFALKEMEKDKSAHAMFLLYAYNPRVGYNYAGWHNVAESEEFITASEFKDASDNQGLYAGTRLCEKAQAGTGPNWQQDASHNPTAQYHFTNDILMRRTASRETVKGETDVSRLRIDFSFEDSAPELNQIQAYMNRHIA